MKRLLLLGAETAGTMVANGLRNMFDVDESYFMDMTEGAEIIFS